MYSEILKALYQLNNAHSEEEKVRYLQSLQDPARALWLRYKNQYVRVDYADYATQAAYILRYFPQYSQIIRILLNQLKAKGVFLSASDKAINCALFGSGPCPEACGIVQYVNDIRLDVKTFQYTSFDINANSWGYSRDITQQHILPSLFRDSIKGSAANFDLSLPINMENFDKTIGEMNLVVFQNCLNEINPAKYTQTLANLLEIYNRLSSNTLLILIDLSGFSSVMQLLSDFQSKISSGKIVEPLDLNSKRYFAAGIVNTMPTILRTNLLNGSKENQNGLIPRVNIDYHTIAIRK